jgi:hypothetical protein
MDTNNHEKANCDVRLGQRPHCRCCAGGDRRKGRKHTRAASSYQTQKHKRAKPKSKDHR